VMKSRGSTGKSLPEIWNASVWGIEHGKGEDREEEEEGDGEEEERSEVIRVVVSEGPRMRELP
jgi:hypothetical protein